MTNQPSPNRWPIVNQPRRPWPTIATSDRQLVNRPYQPRTAAGRSA